MFPTIPTVAANRVAVANQTDSSATRTFPSLSSPFTKNAGDLLIAIVVAYQTGTGTNAAFSGWTGSFTEFHDSATSTTLAMGAAYKWSTGSETGTIAVTQAGTITGDASMILLAISGAHDTTPPEAGGRASGTTSAADPGSVTASWGAEDNLWVTVVGSGMTSGTGSWTATGTTPPTNYTGWVDTAATDTSTIGDCEAAVGFRQLNAASEDVGPAGVDVSNARSGAFTIVVRPAAVPAVPTDVRVSFPTPVANLTGSQEFRALVRRKEASAPATNPTVALELWESGGKVADVVTGVAVTSTAGQVVSGTWSATALAAVSGANVECKVVSAGSSGGTVEVGAIEWNLARVAATYQKTGVGAAAGAAAGVQTVQQPATPTKTGLAAAAGAAAGVQTVQAAGATTYTKAGLGVATGAALGSKTVQNPITSTKAGLAAAGAAAGGAKTVTAGGTTYTEAGTAAVAMVGAGPARITTGVLYAGSAVGIVGVWADTPNAVGASTGDYATWTDSSTSAPLGTAPLGTSPFGGTGAATIELASFNAHSAMPDSAPVDAVTVTVRHSEDPANQISSVVAQAYLGATPYGSAQALTVNAAVHEDTITVTGLTYADLTDLRVQVTATRA